MAEPSTMLIDNWTLEDVGELLSQGPKGDQASFLRISDDGLRYAYEELNWDVVAFECLAQTLSNIVLTDVCYVDADNSRAWIERYDCLKVLTMEALVRTRSFSQNRDAWVPIRESIVEDLLTCPEMRERHEENKMAFNDHRELPDEMLSQILHGGAGMMARARLAELPYSTHPQRQELVQRAAFMYYPTSAQNKFNEVLQTSRMNIYQRSDAQGLFAQISLPPVAIQIINEANGSDDLLITAIQMRDRYKNLRAWLAEFQQELNGDDTRTILSRLKLLTDLGKSIEVNTVDEILGGSTVQMGVTDMQPKASVKGSVISALRNKFGVRAQITRLLLAEPGLKAVRRFCGFFEARQSVHALHLERELQKRWSAKLK